MSQQRETGIVLSKQSSGEADNICTIYTKNSGKDRFVFPRAIIPLYWNETLSNERVCSFSNEFMGLIEEKFGKL
ncbi:recombination protein O N-terminal domain-containing protein [bacterium]|nr:recombination protein O N-terminal domain-containing protein [bacterium]MBU1025857.1 recombination protein O N-terminal domain-containing protein [bacterium]